MTPTNGEPWLHLPESAGDDAFRLFCFPYAGAGTQVYRQWAGVLGERGRVVPVRLPGREARFLEPAYEDLRTLVGDLVTGIAAELDRPYALFGHSMGALIAFELAAAVTDRGLRAPEVLFVSGHQPPHLPSDVSAIELGSVASARDTMRGLGTLAPGLADAPDELAELVFATLAADITLCASYELPAPKAVPVDIVALCGSDDPTGNVAAMRSWAGYTTRGFACHVVHGDHFFLHSNVEQVTALVSAAVNRRTAFPAAR
jgi:medium-chain acyl-[acyl-carrier-protein] hydrolase